MHTRSAVALLSIFLAMASLVAHAQLASQTPTFGVTPFNTYLGENENISIGTGNVHIQIPFFKLPGRNGHDVVTSMNYNSQLWYSTTIIDGLGNPHFLWVANYPWTRSPRYTLNSGTAPLGADTCTGAYNVQLGDGRVILFPNLYLRCYHILPNGGTQYDPQFDNYTATAGASPCSDLSILTLTLGATSTLRLENGEILSFPNNGISTDEDSNGNIINDGTDTLGRSIPFSTSSLTYTDASGQTRTITFNNQSYTIAPHFGFITPPDPTPFSMTLPASIVLANQDRYDFDYNEFGELTKITYPSGGYTRYVFNQYSSMREISERDVCRGNARANGGACPIAEEKTTFFPTPTHSGIANTTNIVVDPLGNQTAYSFTGDSQVGGPWETRRATPLRTITTTPTCAGPTQQIVTLNDTGQQSMTQWDHDSTTYYAYHSTGTTNTSSVTAKREYDWTGSLVRQTITSWLNVNPVNGQNYRTSSLLMLDRKTSEIIRDGPGNPIAETDYEYDNYSTPIQASGAIQLDPAFAASASPLITTRGNLTSVKRWLKTTNSFLPPTTNTYDDAGNVLSTTDPKGSTTSFSYADNFTDSLNHNAKAYLTQTSLPATNGVSHITKTQYDYNTGLVMASCGQNFSAACTNTLNPPQSDYAKFTYDLMNRPTSTTKGDGGTTTTAYSDDTGQISPITLTRTQSITASLNRVDVSLLNGLGDIYQTQEIRDPDGPDFVDTTYDALGRKKTVSNPYRSMPAPTDGITSYTYDPLGRTCVVGRPDGAPAPASCPASAPSGDVFTSYSGNCVTITDEAGKARKSCRDALGRLTQVFEDPSGSNLETDYQYDALDNLVRVDQKGTAPTDSTQWRTRTFTYDGLSRLKCAANPEVAIVTCPSTDTGTYPVGAITYTYDPNSNVQTKTAPAPNQTGSATVVTTFAYDALNRLIQKSYSDGSTPPVRYGYDGVVPSGCVTAPPALTDGNSAGNRTSMCDGSGATSWSHDLMGRIASERRTIAGSANITNTITYAPYNLDGSIANLTYPSGRTLTYGPGGAGRPLSVVESAHSLNYLTNAAYTPAGALASFQNGASIQGRLTYNSRLQPLQIYYTSGTVPPLSDLQGTTCSSTAPTLLERVYFFGLGTSDNGNVNSIADCLNSTRTQNFLYDNLNRITDAYTNGKTTSVAHWGEQYTVDPWGNLTNIALRPNGWQHSESLNAAPASTKNQLNGFCHDSAGNLVLNSACPGGTLSPTFFYDAENRLKATAGYTYIYDGDGKRVVKCNGTYPTCFSATLYWTGTGLDTLAETDWTGAALEEYVFFNGKRIARRDATGNAVKYYFSDHLGSTSIIASSTGVIQKQTMYYPYGGEISIVGPNFANNYKFTGKERDSESGLDDFGARHYASPLARFMSPDRYNALLTRHNLEAGGLPSEAAEEFLYGYIENPQNWNQYAYVRNNPTGFVDPTGAAPVDGHHLIISRSVLNSPLARDFTDAIKTGALSGNGKPNQPGFNELHRAYNAAVEEVLQEEEQTMGDRNTWNVSQWKAVAEEILNSQEAAIKNFLDDLEANNPGARNALAAAIAGYRVSKLLFMRAVIAALGSAIVRLPAIFMIDIREITSPHRRDFEADKRPPHERCLMTRDGQCVD